MTPEERSKKMFSDISHIIWGVFPVDHRPVTEIVMEINKKNIEEAIQQERERCAKIAEDFYDDETMYDLNGDDICKRIAKAIREEK